MSFEPTMGGKNVLIMVGPDFEDREVCYPHLRMLEAGANVTLAGLGEASYTGKYGLPLTVDGPMEAYENKPWDAVFIPGGWAPDKIRMNEAALNIVRKTLAEHRVVASICHGGWVLTSADVVRGRKVTSYVAIKDDLIHAGAYWVDEEVVVDGTLVTSRTPWDLPAFCRTTLRLMAGMPVGV